MKVYPPGSLIAEDFEVVSKPMVGGMGIVYFCVHRGTSRPFALKTFQPRFLSDRDTRDRFLREASVWIDLKNHPNIVQCYHIRTLVFGLETFLVLELVVAESGRKDASLRSWLTSTQPMPVNQSLAFAIQMARGMQYACQTIPGFIHRDLKPENLLIGADKLPNWQFNRLRVTDFGLSVIMEDLNSQVLTPLDGIHFQGLTQTNLTKGIVGTPLYMAPEQWLGQKLGTYTDIYAFGCILLEMLSGSHPVEGMTISELRANHCSGKLHTIPENLSTKVKQMLKTCLALQTGQRYESWDELIEQLYGSYHEFAGHRVPDKIIFQNPSQKERKIDGWSHNTIGQCYLKLDKFDVAQGYFERALHISQLQGDKKLQAIVLSNLCDVYNNQGKYELAINHQEQSLEISRIIADREGEAISLGKIGNIYQQMGHYPRAIEFYEKHLELARSVGDSQSEAVSLGNLGSVYATVIETPRAIEYYERAVKILHTLRSQQLEAIYLEALGNVHSHLKQYERAIGYQEQSLEIHRAIGNREGEADALNGLGDSYLSFGRYERAISYQEQSMEIHRAIGNQEGEADALDSLGENYSRLERYPQAIEYFKQSLVISRAISKRKSEASTLSKLGSVHNQLDDFPRAIEYYEQSLQISQTIGDGLGEATTMFQLAISYYLQGEKTNAISMAQESCRLSALLGLDAQVHLAQRLIIQLQSNSVSTEGKS